MAVEPTTADLTRELVEAEAEAVIGKLSRL
jgi:hypothetical protein